MDILCTSPMRNFKPAPFRQWAGYETVVGKWSLKFHEFPERVFPDFCLGFEYILTPKLAGILSHATGMMLSNQVKISRLEDIFLTRLTRRQIKNPRSRVLPLEPLANDWIDWILQCPFLSGGKNIFANSFIIEKRDYLNFAGLKFYSRCFLETYFFDHIIFLFSNLISIDSMPVIKSILLR